MRDIDRAITDIRRHSLFRSIAWVAGATVLILMVPLVAMQFTREVAWSPSDFIVAGALLFGTGFTFVLMTRKADSLAYRAGVALGLGASLFLVWAMGAVGIIGVEGDPFDLMYFGVLAIGFLGAILARFQAGGMSRALFAMAAAFLPVTAIAFFGGKHLSPESSVMELIGINAMFAVLFTGSGLLFQQAARQSRDEPLV